MRVGGNNPTTPTSPSGTQLPPTRIRIAPGEVVRFRMLNACSDLFMPIRVEGHDVHLIALDGVNFGAVRTIPPPVGGVTGQLSLAPANRAEFLIKGSTKPGIYPIVQLPQSQQFLTASRKVIAEIEVAGTPKEMALPTSLPVPSRYYPLPGPDTVKVRRNIWLGGFFPCTLNPVVGIDFLVNNAQYQEQAVPEIVNLGDVEEWYLQVYGTHHGGSEGHPFHIHVNHFEVVSIDGVAQPPGTIQDTVWIQAKTTVVIRMKFKEFRGKAVFHCHILPHEDTGMMQNFLILDASQHGSGH
jgi:FtsP/CotA-like multicopper oxidase with cupredoxin domain